MISGKANWVRYILKENDDIKLQKELSRLDNMKKYEKMYDGMIIAGVDEAGRGPLAGPVVAGCVVLDKNTDILYINDSKKLSEKKREILYQEIIDKSLAYGIGIADNILIDKINILEATHVAMKEAYINCDKMYKDRYGKNIDMLLVDALNIKNIDIKQVAIIRGDQASLSIAAGSIIAKVTRDRMMIEYDKMYQGYNFSKNKAYGTKEHMDILRKIGPSPIHRKSFLGFLDRHE